MFYLGTTEVFGVMFYQANGNQYATKLKLYNILFPLPNLVHTKDLWHFISIRVVYPDAVSELSKIMFDVAMDEGVFEAHYTTTLT